MIATIWSWVGYEPCYCSAEVLLAIMDGMAKGLLISLIAGLGYWAYYELAYRRKRN